MSPVQSARSSGIGPIPVQRPKVRDRADVPAEEKIRGSWAILPKWVRRSKSLDALLPALYFRGLSTGDVQEALAAVLGAEAPNLSPRVQALCGAEQQPQTLFRVLQHHPSPPVSAGKRTSSPLTGLASSRILKR